MKKSDAPWEKITVDGESYHWRIRHGWLVESGVGVKATSISVSSEPGRLRELILDFPFSAFGHDRTPKQSHLMATLQREIRAAMSAGWKPDSRGRAFRFVPSAE
jgi:hypothetical protein